MFIKAFFFVLSDRFRLHALIFLSASETLCATCLFNKNGRQSPVRRRGSRPLNAQTGNAYRNCSRSVFVYSVVHIDLFDFFSSTVIGLTAQSHLSEQFPFRKIGAKIQNFPIPTVFFSFFYKKTHIGLPDN